MGRLKAISDGPPAHSKFPTGLLHRGEFLRFGPLGIPSVPGSREAEKPDPKIRAENMKHL